MRPPARQRPVVDQPQVKAMSSLVQIGKVDFRFECQRGCIECCTQPGEVYLTKDDVSRIAGHLGQTTEQFRTTLCETDADGGLRLTTPADKACHFVPSKKPLHVFLRLVTVVVVKGFSKSYKGPNIGSYVV